MSVRKFGAGQMPRAVEIYNQLALPQWDTQGRVLALLDLEQRQRQAGHTTEADKAQAQLQPFHLKPSDLKAAQQTLAEYVEKGRATLLERDENIAITERQLAIIEADNEKLRAASAASSDLSAPIFLADDPWWLRRKDANGNGKPSARNR